ncbi:MAG: bacteriohopanetetrol glucosamine biosynthesis glycosyltransferase HpnI [Acetobacteraceae bacterium]|nr:bacteriohopanetetrol glucosamine biosynthesis glycosyltransferase HpnI [Acetobacteraceae bacterium]
MIETAVSLLAWFCFVGAALGILQAAIGSRLVRRFAGARGGDPAHRPPVTVLKPLHGDEPLLEVALASVCAQRYPNFQVVFGVGNAADPALRAVHRVRERFPDCDIAVVIDPARHGRNGKVGNLINMLPAAKHDLLVISDSDVHVAADYLDRLVAALELPGTGLVTTVYAGLPSSRGWASRLGAAQIAYGFLPGALMARALGRQDCLGASMMLRRETLNRIGGLPALVRHLADDNVLGQLVRRQGLSVRLAHTVPATTVPEETLSALFSHELRWARTIRALAPVSFLLSAVQYPVWWAALGAALAGCGTVPLVAFGVVWASRAMFAHRIDRALALHIPDLAFRVPVWLLPMRDAMSAVVMVASYAGRRVAWRGDAMDADGGVRTHPVPPSRPAYAAQESC